MLSAYYSYWLLQTIAMLLTAFILPGLRVTSIFGALCCVLLLGFVNATIWDAALFFHVPDTVSTHSLMLLFSNSVMFWILVKIVPGIEIKGMMAVLVAPIIFTLISLYLHSNFKDVDWTVLLSTILTKLEAYRDQLIRNSY